MLVTYAIQRLQHVLPFNPQQLGAVEAASAFNTAASFTTNTNWQGYVGEATMSYLTQMAGLAWHNFISAAVGIAVALALARGITRRGDGSGPGTIGNFWVDITRATVYILLPISVVFALVFVSQGMIQNLSPYVEATTLEGARQVIAIGPVASQESIKQLRDQRRRLLQRQCRASLREPESPHELPLDVPDLRDPVRADLHLRAHGRQSTAGLGAVRRDVVPLPGRRHRRLLGGGGGQPDDREPPGHRTGPREHGGQGGPLRRRELRALRDGHHGRVAAAPSTRCTTASPRSAGW